MFLRKIKIIFYHFKFLNITYFLVIYLLFLIIDTLILRFIKAKNSQAMIIYFI